MMAKEHDEFRLTIEGNKVINLGYNPSIGVERDNLVRIIVAVLDLEGFTNFFNKASPNQSIIVASYVNGFLSWLNHRLDLEGKRLPRPRLSKFLGDGVLYVWETEEGKTEQIALDLMNFCWNITRSKTDKYEESFRRQFIRQLGKKWDCEYPKHLRASLATGFAVKYTRRNHPPEYVSECINIASRLYGIHPELYFVAHSDLFLDDEIKTAANYVEKRIKIKGIDKQIAIFIDKDDFDALTDKSIFEDI